MKVIDISTVLQDGMVRYPSPYLPEVSLVPVATHDREGRSVHVLTCGTHVSTHLDAPFHAIPDGATVDQIPPSQLIGPARIVRIPDRDKSTPLTESDIAQLGDLSRVEKLVLDTGWARRTWGTKEYFTEGPFLTRDASRLLAGLPALHLVGMDFPNVDCKEETRIGTPAPNHQILLGQGMVLLENLLRLEEVDDDFLLSAAPPNLVGGDGCVCRALALFPLRDLSEWARAGT